LHDPGEDEHEDEAAERRRRRLPPAATDRRILTLQKTNYAKQGTTIELVCRDGIFTPAALDPERAKARQTGPGRNAAAEQKFLELLAVTANQGRRVHHHANNKPGYAPAVFARGKPGFSQPEFARAMERLFADGRLKVQTYGPPSRERAGLVAL
jgi:hypothetical protein